MAVSRQALVWIQGSTVEIYTRITTYDLQKKRHRRVPLAASAIITYTIEESSERILAMIADISLSGIGVYSDKRIREGTDVSIEITFISATGLMTTDSTKGESVYIREIGGMYFIGIEFDEEINPIKQPSVHEHLQKILGSD